MPKDRIYQYGRMAEGTEGLYLVGGVASDLAEDVLSCTDGGVDVGAEGGGLVVIVGRHDDVV